jgi:hypothetical protein
VYIVFRRLIRRPSGGCVTGITYSGKHFTGITLTNPAAQNPVTISRTGYITNTTTTNKGDALYGSDVAAWSLTNFGTIKGTGSLAHGVKLTAGGTIANHGLIENASGPNFPFHYQNAAITIQGSAGTVLNSGTIRNTGSYDAIRLDSGGAVTNLKGALISGVLNGIQITGGTGVVTNFGMIEGKSAAGVNLYDGGGVTNQGVIIGATDGVYLSDTGTATQIVNFATISGKVGFDVAAENTADNTLTNSGTIVGTGGTAVQFGAGNNMLIVDHGAVFKGAVNGGSGTNEVEEGAAGVLDVKGFSGFETIVLANGGKDSLTLTGANFAGVAGSEITVTDGNRGNDITATGLAASDILVVHAGTGADFLVGGAGTNVFYAGGDTTMTGGQGTNEFIFTQAGKNVIKDFAVSSTNELVFSDAGFDLGLGGATSTPQQMTTAEAETLFVADATGKFTDTGQRLAYDTKSGQLFASSDGSGSPRHLVATLSGHPTIDATQLFFVS